ncbi:MAG: glycoside hydrolase family 13 protein [Acidimicrobiia bacterium]
MSLAESLPLVGTALAAPHHDGSELYLLERPQEPGDEAVVRLRVPRTVEPETVLVRYLHDGEPRAARAEIDEENEWETWWRARFPAWNPSTRYRWLLSGGDAGWTWVNGAGASAHDVPDADDFVVAHDPGGPDWHRDGVVYEIFPDRFASSGLAVDIPDWAMPRDWDLPPTGRGPETARQLYGGDLRGIEQRLDHIERLGATALYLTPIFPARSSHRYDATSFDRVDPLLGGEEALDSLLRVAHGRGLRVIGDLTANHTGAGHEWFLAAQADPAAPERAFYLWDDDQDAGYHSWLGHASLPKLDWRSPELRARFEAVARRWLERGLDGWRIDVANMTGRHHEIDLHLEVARLLRAAAGDAVLVAEHGHDFRADVPGGGWQGVMNYAGFLRPAWTWLRRDNLPEELQRMFWGLPVGLPRLDGTAAATAMTTFRTGLPWTAVAHSWSLLDSHDTARFRTVAGRERQLVGIGLQMTMPGVPMVFAGDELGLEGEWGEDARRSMPWDRPESWDTALLGEYRRLIALRHSSDALKHGGCRWAHVEADCLAYLRETGSERLLCLAGRDAHAPVRLSLAQLGARGLETLYGSDAKLEGGDALLPADGPSFHVWRMV